MLRRSLLTRNFPAAWRLLLLPSSRYVGSATSRPCSTVPSTAAVSTPRPYALEFGEHRPPSPSKRLKYRIDVLKKMLERKEGDLQPEPYDEEDCPDLKDYEYTDSETYWDGVPVLESEIEPPLKDSILEFGKYDKAEAELLPSIQKSLVELMLSGDHNDLVLVKHKQTSTNAIRMKKRWKVFYKYAYLLPDELTEKLERMTRELEDLVEREDLEEKVEFLRLLTDHWKKALMSYSNRLEAAGKEEEAAPQLDVVQPSPASAAPYTSNDAASYALEQLGIGYGYLGHDDWLWEFKELMEEYFKGRISRDVLPDLITESILKFRFEEVGKKEGRRLCRHGDVVYGEKEVVVLKRGWCSEVERLKEKFQHGFEDVLPAFRKKLLEMRLSGKRSDLIAYQGFLSFRKREFESRVEYFHRYAHMILPDDVKKKLLGKLRQLRDESWEQDYEEYRDFESGILMDYFKRLKAEEEGATQTQFHMDGDYEKNTREIKVKYGVYE